jgi:membrane fusion protein (multidrug efflux system)
MNQRHPLLNYSLFSYSPISYSPIKYGLACFGFSVFLAGCEQPKPAPVAAPLEVSVITAEASDVPVAFEFVGKTSSSRRIEIRSRVEGFLEKRLYQEGSMVEQGQIMFQMDRAPFQAQLDAANAELAQQQARLTNAGANLKRVRPLARQNAVAQKELDDALGIYRSSSAAVAAAKAKVVQAELDLGYTEIKSPVTGVSSFAIKREGSYLGFGDSLLTYVAQIQPMWVEFSISENQIFGLRGQQQAGLIIKPADGDYEVEIVLADGEVYPQRGRLTFADVSLSEETGTFLVRAEIANPHKQLRPGQFVRARLLGSVRPHAILLPQKAVQQGAQGSFVWLVDDAGKTKFQPVDVGSWHGDKWFINKGLQPGDRVIVGGALKVRGDIEVNTVPYSEEDPSAVAQ